MIYNQVLNKKSKGQRMFAILVDPDRMEAKTLVSMAKAADKQGVDFFLVGGSLMIYNRLESVIRLLKNNTRLPVILFPGPGLEFNAQADGILFISLISGRNPDLLIGRHVAAASSIKASGIEVISTGYMLFDSGRMTTAHYLSNTLPLPLNKPDIAAATAVAGELLGMKMIYLEAGSGAEQPLPAALIQAVKKSVHIPVMVGGGLRTASDIEQTYKAGADVVVVGTALEQDPAALASFLKAVKSD